MSESSISCEYCGKSTTSKGNLKKHQLTKKCMEMQAKQGLGKRKSYDELYNENLKLTEEIAILKNLNKEYEIIKKELEIYKNLYLNLQEEHKEETKDTKKILTQLASKPTVSNNSTNNSVFLNMGTLDLSDQRIINALQHYTIDNYKAGSKGMIEWVVPNLLMDENGGFLYRCGDKNRRNFYYKDETGQKVDDVRGAKLLKSIEPHMLPVLKAFRKQVDQEIMDTYGDDDNNYQFTGNDNLISKKQKENRMNEKVLSGGDTLLQLVERVK